jgi:hypothetical protein
MRDGRPLREKAALTELIQEVETVHETIRLDEVDIQQPGKTRSGHQLRQVTAER